MDGYSRKVLWLKVAYSNNEPSFIADHYLNCVLSLKGCPRLLRTDLGTENTVISFLQPALRHQDTDCWSGFKSHRYGKSTSNQRIESFWSQLRRSHIEWWISFFKDMEFNNHFNSSLDWHKDVVRYVFGPIIQTELDTYVTNWNKHRIRKSSMSEVPSGIPNILFDFPELKGMCDYLCPVKEEDLVELSEYCSTPAFVSNAFQLLADAIVSYYQLSFNRVDFNQALDMYFTLMSILTDLL